MPQNRPASPPGSSDGWSRDDARAASGAGRRDYSGGQQHILTLIARGRPTSEALTELASWVERHAPGALCSVMVADETASRLTVVAAPSLPQEFTEAIRGLPIAEGSAVCGTAAHRRQPVVVADTLADPLTSACRPLAIAFNLRAVWSTPIVTSDGTILGTFAMYYRLPATPPPEHRQVVDDATALTQIALERDRSEIALRRSEARFRSLIEHASDMIAIVDRSGVIQYASPAYHHVLGLATSEVVGRSPLDLVAEDDREALEHALAGRRVQSAAEGAILARFRRGDGAYRRLEVVVTNLLDDPAVHGIVLNSRDVTEQESLAAELRHAQKMEAVGQLAGGVAHDFNNILAAIKLNAALLTEVLPPDSDSLREAIEIEQAADSATQITRQLLAFARRQPEHLQEIRLVDVIADIEPLLRRLIGPTIALDLDVPKDIACVLADRAQLGQVVVNLALNARDAMPEGGSLRIVARLIEGGERVSQHGVIELAVSDTGTGIAPEVKDRIFEPFFTTKEPGKGTGLGLSTAYAIVRQLGGEIHVESVPHQFTTFRIQLPAAGEGSSMRVELTPESVELPVGTETILLAEDEELVRRVTARALRGLGYTVIEARHGRDAVQLFDEAPDAIDLLFSDIVMPEIGGWELLRQLRGRRPALPAIVASGYERESMSAEKSQVSSVRFLQKPFTLEALAREVRAALDTAASRA